MKLLPSAPILICNDDNYNDDYNDDNNDNKQ